MLQDDLNYGITHGDFHTRNFMIRKTSTTDSEESKEGSQASQYEVAAFDFDDIRQDWFLSDVAYVLAALMTKASEQNKQMQILDWFIKAYEL